MNLSIQEIIEEFTRHCRLCKGIGREGMLKIVNKTFENETATTLLNTNEHCNNPEGFDRCNFISKDSWVCNMRKCKHLTV